MAAPLPTPAAWPAVLDWQAAIAAWPDEIQVLTFSMGWPGVPRLRVKAHGQLLHTAYREDMIGIFPPRGRWADPIDAKYVVDVAVVDANGALRPAIDVMADVGREVIKLALRLQADGAPQVPLTAAGKPL